VNERLNLLVKKVLKPTSFSTKFFYKTIGKVKFFQENFQKSSLCGKKNKKSKTDALFVKKN
jgi:hypothetical protein